MKASLSLSGLPFLENASVVLDTNSMKRDEVVMQLVAALVGQPTSI